MYYKDEEEFTIKVKMNKRWIPHFLGMLRYMEHLGNVGSSRKVSIYSDGDGDFRPWFEWDIKGIELKPPASKTDREVFYDVK